MAENYEHLLVETESDGIAVVTVNRPDKMNALNSDLLDELDQVFAGLESDTEVKAVIVTGAGDKAFVAGADIKELGQLDQKSGRDTSRKGQQIFDRIESFQKPVVAVVNGYALGGGAELAMACHIRIATDNAVFGLPEVSLGLIPGYGGTQRLPQLVGRGKALEMILSGGMIKAGEALQYGLVNKIAESGDPLNEARQMLAQMLKHGPIALSMAIQAINSAGSDNGYDVEADCFGQLCNTDDFKEGTSAFLEKRKPDFQGR